jgi:FkbM family methyltransferase
MTFIVDVGTSRNALRTIPLRDRFGFPVLFIEPDAEALAQVPANFDDICLNAAITSFDGETKFFFYKDGTHSLLETNLPEIHKYIDGHTRKAAAKEDWTCSRSIDVPCFRLETVLERYFIDSVAFLKIDAQGHDLEVLRSLGARISSVQIFEVEVQVTDFEIYRGQSCKEEVLNFAAENRFELVSTHAQTFGQELNLIFANQNYQRPSTESSSLLILEALDELSKLDTPINEQRLPRRAASFFSRALRTLTRKLK